MTTQNSFYSFKAKYFVLMTFTFLAYQNSVHAHQIFTSKLPDYNANKSTHRPIR